MMSLGKRSNGIYFVRYIDDNGKDTKKSLGTRDLKVARQLMAGQTVTASTPKQPKHSLKEALNKAYREHYRHQDSAYTTRCNINSILSVTGDIGLDDIDVSSFVDKTLKTGVKNSSVNRRLSLLSLVYRFAREDWKWTVQEPKFKKLPEGVKNIKTITDDEEALILDSCDGQLHQLIQILLDTGCRVREILKLEPEDFDEEILHIKKAKGSKERYVPLTSRAYENLKLFVPAQYQYTYYQKKVKKMSEELGIPDFTIHNLRHTCCTRLIRSGANPVLVQKWMGHSDIETTMRYVHLDTDDIVPLRSILEHRKNPK